MVNDRMRFASGLACVSDATRGAGDGSGQAPPTGGMVAGVWATSSTTGSETSVPASVSDTPLSAAGTSGVWHSMPANSGERCVWRVSFRRLSVRRIVASSTDSPLAISQFDNP